VTDPSILLTNEDGVDAAGLGLLREALAEASAEVTVVAPEAAREEASRSVTAGFGVTEHEWGYAVDGTPVDCVHFAHGVLDGAFDALVAGPDHGPNLGAHRLGRSGTIGAVIEAAHLGYPALACSCYDPEVGSRAFGQDDFEPLLAAVTRLLEPLADGLPGGCDFLNVNAPSEGDPRLRVTEAVHDFDVEVEPRADGYHARDRFHDPLADGRVEDPLGNDRRAAADGEVSVTPCTVHEPTASLDALRDLLDG
jgi:5'-nucleotidase